ncbi:glycogen/starch synthase [uncultured Methanobrevibacter sp.]|uniref:glycogen/starch synthase n=1 Tax=uncultured Methanobrevibacter sp. TaxID=253161 RepID=UPI0025FAC55B|nr:glycogen/starch synthase [uncultured Methanobrevibacter sp.]
MGLFFSFNNELIEQKSLNPDIIHINDYHEGFVPYICKNKNLKSKYIVSIHNAYFQGIYEFNESSPKELFNYYIDDELQKKNLIY